MTPAALANATACLTKSGAVYVLTYGPLQFRKGRPFRRGACLETDATFVATNDGITVTHHIEKTVAESGALPFGVTITKDWGTILQLIAKHLDEDCVHCQQCSGEKAT